MINKFVSINYIQAFYSMLNICIGELHHFEHGDEPKAIEINALEPRIQNGNKFYHISLIRFLIKLSNLFNINLKSYWYEDILIVLT